MESIKRWSDYVEMQYEHLENKRKKPVLLHVPKFKVDKLDDVKLIMVVRPRLRSIGWINDLSSKIKS